MSNKQDYWATSNSKHSKDKKADKNFARNKAKHWSANISEAITGKWNEIYKGIGPPEEKPSFEVNYEE